MHKTSERIFGLDLLRSIAIIIVVISHTSFILKSSFPTFPYLPTPDGVDLFFVLSGFLIGKILIDLIEKNNGLDFEAIKYFLKRRWFRTLPNYYVFLLLNILLVSFGFLSGTINKYCSTYFFFFQNFYKPFDFFFWESWSLAIEEWFYILFPLLIFILSRIFSKNFSNQKIIFVSILILIFTPLLIRILQINQRNDWDLYYRRLVITRFDTIAYGILGAYLFKFHYLKWNKFKLIFFIIGISVMLFLFQFNATDTPFFYRTFYFSFEAISILFMLPFLNSLLKEKIPFKPFQFISKISYSMYLVNIPLILLLRPLFENRERQFDIPVFFVFWFLIIFLSYLIYKFFEKPMMNLRDKIS